jgi:peptidoglycan hydrolase-like protein with peptidoglycan-binding domain
MGWQIVRITGLPVGKRILRLGARGGDVAALQGWLAENGFYSGKSDGWYGFLTMEAVLLLQKTFKLRRDGIAGPEVFRTLGKVTRKTGRVIYTVQRGETLEGISQKFGVAPAAWRTIPGHRAGVKDIYPGKKLLLYKKAFFIWEDRETVPEEELAFTGRIRSGIRVNPDGTIDWDSAGPDPRSYFLISGEPAVWEEGLLSKQLQRKIASAVKPLRLHYGWDFRNAPLRLTAYWEVFLKTLMRFRDGNPFDLVLVPFPVTAAGCDHRLIRLFSAGIGPYTRMILVEPRLEDESPDLLRAAAAHLEKAIPQFSRWGADREILWVDSPQGWNWSEEQLPERVSFRECKIIRAMHTQPEEYCGASRFCILNYLKQGKRQTLLYRDLQSWRELLRRLIRYNLGGVALRDFRQLGSAGPELIAASFAVRKGEE